MSYDSKICDQAVNNYPFVIKFIPECCKIHEMCNKAVIRVIRCFVVFDFISDWYKTQEMCDSCFWKSFLVIYCPDKYKTQKMCDKAVDGSLAALKLFPNWFVTSKMIEEHSIRTF